MKPIKTDINQKSRIKKPAPMEMAVLMAKGVPLETVLVTEAELEVMVMEVVQEVSVDQEELVVTVAKTVALDIPEVKYYSPLFLPIKNFPFNGYFSLRSISWWI